MNREPPAVLVQVDEAAVSFDDGREARDDMSREGDAVVVGDGRALGRIFCSRIETELGLPAGCMDSPGMEPAAGEGATAVEGPTKQQKPNGRPEAPIHAAVVDAFWATVRSGAMTDGDCAMLLVQLIGMRSRKGGAS